MNTHTTPHAQISDAEKDAGFDQAQPQVGPVQSSKKSLPLILGGVLVALLLAVGGGYYYTTTPGYVAAQFLKQHIATLRRQDFTGAYAQTTAGFKTDATQAEYQEFAENLGLVSADIPYKVTQKSVYVRDTDLTDQGMFVIRLTGKTGETQDMRFSLTTEYGNWRVRLIEVVGDSDSSCEDSPCAQIGMDYDAPQKTAPAAVDTGAMNEPAPQQPVVQTPPAAAPPAQTAQSDLSWQRLSEVSAPPAGSSYAIVPVYDTRFQNAARVAVEQHIGSMRFGNYAEAIEQLSPEFKAKVTPTDYGQFLGMLGVPDIARYSWEVVKTDVRTVNGVYSAKVRVVFKDFQGTGTGAAPEQLFINLGLYNISKDELGVLDYKRWKIISFFSDSRQAEFFPY